MTEGTDTGEGLKRTSEALTKPTKKIYNWAIDEEFYEHCKAIQETLDGGKNTRIYAASHFNLDMVSSPVQPRGEV